MHPTLIHAAGRGDLEMVKFLVENGTDLEARDSFGNTALHRAAGGGHLPVSKYLVDNRADVNATNDDDLTPRGLAAQNGHGHKDVVEYFDSLDDDE